MRAASAIVLAICSMWLFSQPAFADRRIALVMGNSAYHSVPSLANPANDASAMAKMFEGAGFDTVQLRLDLKAGDMRRALRDFSDDARDADVAIIYFAGHGIEIQGNNYIVPVDAVLERDIDAFDEAIPLDRLLTVIEPARKLRLIILDACRDNPFSKTMKRVTASRAVGRGLAKIEPDGPNTLIAFAAKAGSTADDGDTKHSPFTAALVKYLPTPGLDLRKAFGFVRDDVMRQTRNRQEPFIYGSLGGEDVALVPAPSAPPVDPNAAAKGDYELASQINVVSAWDSFLKKYPSGFYSDLARAQRDKLVASKAAADEARLAAEKKALEDAKAAEAERARVAAQAKAAQDAKIAAEKAKADEAARLAAEKKASEEAKAAEAARAKAAATKLAAMVGGDPAIANAPRSDAPRLSSSCAGASAQLVALSTRPAKALSEPEECGLKPKDTFKECENCPEMAVVPAGEFMMGSSRTDIDSGAAAANEGPQHRAVIGHPIVVGRFEVTRDQYTAFVNSSGHKTEGRCFTFEQNIPQMRDNRSFLNPGYVQDGNHPAVCVSWKDAKAYVDWLSQTTGKPYRLLSETEFEYAARGGNGSRYGFGGDPAEICKFANGADQSAKSAGLPADASYLNCRDGYPFTAPVGSFAANAFGLHDLLGNVWEWTEDCYGDYASIESAERVGHPEPACASRTVRGGDWFSAESSLRPAVRAKADAEGRYDDIGFRVARTLTR
jgi:formylglycine-generating enzyme required for sulfatase activity